MAAAGGGGAGGGGAGGGGGATGSTGGASARVDSAPGAAPESGPTSSQAAGKEQTTKTEWTIDPASVNRDSSSRARDTSQGKDSETNTIEPGKQNERTQGSAPDEKKFAEWRQQAEQLKASEVRMTFESGRPVESTNGSQTVVPTAVEQEYLRVGNKFYHPKDTQKPAFEDKGDKLETKSDSKEVAGALVRIAQSRGWDEIKVSGSEDFRKEVWLQAAAQGVPVKGYTPTEQDKVELAMRTREAQSNRIDKDNSRSSGRENETASARTSTQARPVESQRMEIRTEVNSQNAERVEAFRKDSPADAVKKHPDLAGAYAAEAAMDKKARADGLTPQQRTVVMARIRENTANSLERGDIPQVKVREEKEIKHEAKHEAKEELQQSR
jgi:hypothetical protein